MPKMFSRQEIFYLQNEASYGVIPNSSGTATVASADACAMIQFKMKRTTGDLVRKDKTGTRTPPAGVAGRKIAEWSSNMSLVTGATPGTAPDCDPILRSGFGAAPTAKTGTVSVTGATNAAPIVITATAHGLSTYDAVTISSVAGNTAANGVWAVNVLTSSTFELINSSGNGSYTSGGSINKAALVYGPADAELSFAAYSFRGLATGAQRCLSGAVAELLTFNLGEDIATWQASGMGKWVLDSKTFSSATTLEKCGLTAFPTDPGSPVTLGAGIAGFKGMAYLNGSLVSRIRTAQVKFGSGLDLPRDLFGSDFVDSPEADERKVLFNFNMYETDDAAVANMEQAANDKTGLDMVIQSGTTAGSIYFMVLRGVQLASPDRDDSGRAWTLGFGDSRAYGTGITAFNEMKLWVI